MEVAIRYLSRYYDSVISYKFTSWYRWSKRSQLYSKHDLWKFLRTNLAEQLTSSDFGVSTGLISQGYWETSKWYFINLERGNIADKLQPRNINVSFINNREMMLFIGTWFSNLYTAVHTPA